MRYLGTGCARLAVLVWSIRPSGVARSMRRTTLPACAVVLTLTMMSAHFLQAQERDADQRGALAVADSALALITRGDRVGLTDLMLDEALLFPVGPRNGEPRYSVRTRAEMREGSWSGTIVERGFQPEVRVSGPVAMVWMPYDLYMNGEWSHCGVDVFTLIKHDGSWRIATLAWTVEQPPACEKHPAGPPR